MTQEVDALSELADYRQGKHHFQKIQNAVERYGSF